MIPDRRRNIDPCRGGQVISNGTAAAKSRREMLDSTPTGVVFVGQKSGLSRSQVGALGSKGKLDKDRVGPGVLMTMIQFSVYKKFSGGYIHPGEGGGGDVFMILHAITM